MDLLPDGFIEECALNHVGIPDMIYSVPQPPRNEEFKLFHKDQIRKPRTFKVLQVEQIFQDLFLV